MRQWTPDAAGDWHEWSIIERLGWWAIIGALVGVPTFFFKWGLNAFDVPKLALLWACSWLAMAGVVASVMTGRVELVRLRIRWAVVAFVATQVAATLLSISPLLSLFGSYGRYMGLVPMLLFLSLAFATVCYGSTSPGLIRHLLGATAIVTLASALVALLEPAGLDLGFKTGTNYTGTSVGLQGNSDFSAGVLAMGFPSLLYLRAFAERQWIRIGAVVAMPFVVVAMFLLNSRGAFIALAVGIVAAGWANRHLVPRFVTVAGTAAVALVLGALVVLGVTRAGPMGDTFSHIPLLRSETFVQRIDIWRGTVGVIADRPVLGSGPDTLGITLAPHQPAELSTRPMQVDAAHDVVLQTGAGSGVLGMVTYILLIGWTIVQGFRGTASLSGTARGVAATSVAILCAYVAQALFSIDELQIAVYGWIALGMVLALSDPGALASQDSTADRERRALPAGWSLGLSVVAMVLVLVSVVPVVADARFGRAAAAASGFARDPRFASPMLSAVEDAEALNPLEATYPAEGARYALEGLHNLDTASKKQLLDWIEDQIERAEDLQPGHRELKFRLARVYDQRAMLGDLPQFERAEDLLRSLEEEDPYDPKAKVERSYHLQSWRDATGRDDLVAEMRSEARAIESLPYLYPTGWCQVSSIYSRTGDHDDAIRTARRCAALLPQEPGARQRLAEAERRGR